MPHIKYKDKKLSEGQYSPKSFKTMNERTNNISDYALAAGVSLTSIGLPMIGGLPVAMVFAPKTTGEKASSLESMAYNMNRRDQKKGVQLWLVKVKALRRALRKAAARAAKAAELDN